MSYIGRGTESISNVEVLDNLTFNGSASYTLQKSSVNFVPSSANNLLISISGVVQQGNFSVSGSTITFDTTVSGSDTCDWILHYGTGLITTPADGTVSNDKIAYPLAKSGATVSTFNRTTSDGTILDFQKDGTSAGTLKTVSGVTLALDGSGSFAGFQLGGSGIVPRQGGTLSTSVDLGTSSYPFNNVYVGSNIYLGGTGSANALDDYEEGTFTVTNAGDATGALSAETGEYTKVGNIVFIRITFDVSTNFTTFGRIGGLPFTTSGDGTVSSFYPANVMTDSSTNSQILPNFHTNQTYMTLKEDDTNLNDHFPNTTNNIYRICGFYFTNS